jgi:hypothetical protein
MPVYLLLPQIKLGLKNLHFIFAPKIALLIDVNFADFRLGHSDFADIENFMTIPKGTRFSKISVCFDVNKLPIQFYTRATELSFCF